MEPGELAKPRLQGCLLSVLIAKQAICRKPQPCNECSACMEIKAGRHIEFLEVDAASRTGVDDMRELLESVQYKPANARYKIYLIDEVHMLSKSSFNALLKTLEEPPPHVMFLMATTEVEKVPKTVLSRCLQLNLKIIPEKSNSRTYTVIVRSREH